MKRFAVLLIFSLWLSSCSHTEILKEPPRASVFCGDQQIYTELHNDSWEYKNFDGSVSSYISDGIGILNTKKETVLTKETVANIRFDTEPKTLSVECWPEKKRGTEQTPGQFLPIKEHQFSLRSGSYIYAIHASWETKKYSGNASYVVVIHSTAEEPILTQPPVLTVTCGDKTTTAKLGTYSWTHREGDKMVSANADSSHPLMILTKEDRVSFKEGVVSLAFDVPPDRMESYCWNDTDLGKTVGGNLITDYWAGYQMDSTNGGYIIEIQAFWENRTGYEGSANYCFYIDKQPAES